MNLFCRDGHDMAFNRDAWMLFYEMIFYHQGVLEYLIKNNLLSPFLELVGTNYNNIIMTNGLDSVTRVFDKTP